MTGPESPTGRPDAGLIRRAPEKQSPREAVPTSSGAFAGYRQTNAPLDGVASSSVRLGVIYPPNRSLDEKRGGSSPSLGALFLERGGLL